MNPLEELLLNLQNGDTNPKSIEVYDLTQLNGFIDLNRYTRFQISVSRGFDSSDELYLNIKDTVTNKSYTIKIIFPEQ